MCRDGLHELLKKIRHADGLIFGSPVYPGDISAGLRALYERLVFQSITYKAEMLLHRSKACTTLVLMKIGCPPLRFHHRVRELLLSPQKLPYS